MAGQAGGQRGEDAAPEARVAGGEPGDGGVRAALPPTAATAPEPVGAGRCHCRTAQLSANTIVSKMLSTPPRAMSTRSGLIAGKKRILSSPTKSNNNNNNNDLTPAKTPRKPPRTPTKTTAITTKEEAKEFSKWFQHMIDEDRHNFILYLAEDVILEWFGRTIRMRKKVAGFLEYDMKCSRHDFTSVVGCAPFTARVEKSKRQVDSLQTLELATPLDVAETPTAKLKLSLNQLTVRGSSLKKRPGLRSSSASPEKRLTSPAWETNSANDLGSQLSASERKRTKLSHVECMDVDGKVEPDSGHGKSETTRPRSVTFCRKLRFDSQNADEGIDEMSHRGDEGGRKYATTPAKRERGQGDCLPTTSCEPRAVYPTPPRKYVECNGFVEFTRSKNKRCVDGMKWERKCKLQVCYTEDPVNVGEYVIWTIVYSDDAKCRRNLMAAFDEVAKLEETKRKLF